MTQGPVIDRRRFLLASLGGLAGVALAGCGSREPSGTGGRPTLRLPQGALGFPSPFAANADLGYNQMSLIYDTLLWKDGGGQLLPWLAATFSSSPDHLVYTFQLRDGLRWSDGRPLTSEDVVFTFDYYAAQETLPPPVMIQPPRGIANVRATGPATVEIRLDEPDVVFDEQVAGALPIIPKHVWSRIDDPAAEQSRRILVGSGPYRLASYSGDGGALLYEARDDYFLGAPYVRRIEERAIEEPFGALLSGAADAARGVGLRSDILDSFRDETRFGMITDVGTQASVVYWNLGKEGPLSDVRFRQAFAMAVDRRDLVSRLAAGRGEPGNPGFLSPSNPWFTPVRQYDFDPAGATALLDAAGYRPGSSGIRQAGNGAPLSFELLISNGEAPLGEILVGALRRVGVDLRMKPVEIGPQLFGNKLVGNYDIAVLPFPGPGPGGPNADPDILRLLFSSNLPASLQAASAYADPGFNELAAAQKTLFDAERRRAVVHQMQAILADSLPVLPLYYPEVAILFRKAVIEEWYFTPGQFPSAYENKQLFVTGMRTGTTIRSAR